MAPQPKPPTPATTTSGTNRALLELGRGMVGELAAEVSATSVAEDAGGWGSGAEVELALSELIRDGNGEIVIYNDSGFRTLAITTEATVVASGESGRHITEAGEDVSGFRFITFNDGTTLYYPEGLDLVAHPDSA